jgi:hypothetical protein
VIHAPLPRVSPGVRDVLSEALAVIARCADVAAVAGCAPAATYIAGAGGNIRRALAELVHRNPHLSADGADEFDVQRVGATEVVSMAGYPDTIRNCLVEGGSTDVRALVQDRQVERCVWMRATGELENVHVRGRVTSSPGGYRFVDEPDREDGFDRCGRPDLGRDLLASGLDLSSRPTFASALEVALTTASWVHLASRARWYADAASARAIVRLAGGTPTVDARLLSRLGVCVDRAVLREIEALGWRHWPVPSSCPKRG